MACCKCCCGNVDCGEGDQGKCCCGGSEGQCCGETEYCCDGACQEGPCAECTVDEECCLYATEILVPPCSDPASGYQCCPPTTVAWVDDPGDARYGNCVTDCAPGVNVVSSPSGFGSCCDNVCYNGDPCPP